MAYELKTGQINFENTDHPGAYVCVVIKKGEFHNLSEPLRVMLIEKLQRPVPPAVTSAEDMF